MQLKGSLAMITKLIKHNGCFIELSYQNVIPPDEALQHLQEQLLIKPNKKLVSLEIKLDGDYLLLRPHYDTVRRIRRITGYLSEVTNFNSAKRAEEHDRVKHIK